FFGLIHGFGFAGVLAELNLPTARFAWALLQFNLGLEVGQLMIVVGVTALLFALRKAPRYPAWVIRGGSAAAILVGTLWLIERTANVSLLGW
ncbi:MAG: HupE/UreJ family protein, partial [Caldimonas sp.]